MDVPKGVLPDSPQVAVEETKAEPVVIPEEIKPTPEAPKGTKTPEANLYAALEEERRKRKEAEEKLYSISSEPQVSEAFSGEGKLLEKKINDLQGVIHSLQEKDVLSSVQSQYPQLRELSEEFNSFRSEFPQSKIENVAKLFLMEKGLLDAPRKGLERQTTGGQGVTSDGLTAEEVSDLRKNNHRKYTELLMAGKIKLDELK